jgi:deoxyribodipyrimidine photo-lyase
MKKKISIFWFRRDLRLDDNRGLNEALKASFPVLPIFIFDDNITDDLNDNDARITFIYNQIEKISIQLKKDSCSLLCKKGDLKIVWSKLIEEYDIQEVYTNEDYEPYAIKRDLAIQKLLSENSITFKSYKDQVVFAKNDVLKKDNTPYTVFTPFKNRWISKLETDKSILEPCSINRDKFFKINLDLPSLESFNFKRSSIKVQDYRLNDLDDYEETRNFPGLDKTSYLSPHLRFGTISIREIIEQSLSNECFLSELIWREFFMQIIYHFPEVVHSNFKRKYDNIEWRNNPEEFDKWKNGNTGYPIVDAGMRELNATGYMHNRVRMVVAGFLCKHLLIDWRWGEAYFAEKLLDYELSSNNGNWQWASGTGCDSAPYFRIFNPTEQVKKFDSQLFYINKWIPELNLLNYPSPIVDHKYARTRAIEAYKKGIFLSTTEL